MTFYQTVKEVGVLLLNPEVNYKAPTMNLASGGMTYARSI
jgi:hypothetical protein